MTERVSDREIVLLLHKVFGTNANPHADLFADVLQRLRASHPGVEFVAGEATKGCEPARWIHWQTGHVFYSNYFTADCVNLTRRVEGQRVAHSQSFDPNAPTLLRDLQRAI